MLRDEGGRFQTVQTEADFIAIFQHEFEALHPHERAVALTAFDDFLQGERSPIIELGSQSLYRNPPVTMQQFLTDPYFLGEEIVKILYPAVKSELCDIFSGVYDRAILGGALGLGKTMEGVVAILRMIYEASCLWSPHQTYKVSPSDFIMFPCISSTEEVAERNIIDKIRSIIAQSPYFLHEFKPEKNSYAAGIVFPNKLLIPPGASTMSQIIGGTVAGAFFDETNFFLKRNSHERSGEVKENIEVIYEAIDRRRRSRFQSRNKLPGVMIIASSKATANSFTERLIRKCINDPKVYVSEKSVWEVHPPERYSGKKFKIAIGNETKMSRILKDEEPEPDAMKVLEIPIEFYDAFEDDIDGSIRDFAGYSTVAITPFITRREKIYECIDTREHPFPLETWDQSFPAEIDWTKIARLRKDGAWEPLHHPGVPRHVHLDLSKNQCETGFALGCVAGYTPVQRFGREEQEMAPIIHVDFLLQIRAPMGGEIIYADIRKLIYEFSQHGFYIKLVSADQFQSLSLLQTMRAQGYHTKVVSVETAGGPYELLKTAFYENRVQMYRYPPLITELRELQKNWKTGKVDHPDKGSKDVSDALASVAATLTENHAMALDQPIQRGGEVKVTDDEGDGWINDGHVPIGDAQNDPRPEWRKNGEDVAARSNDRPEWRQNAEKILDEQPGAPSRPDWRQNFSMPFILG